MLNDQAIGAYYLLARRLAKRILILDLDVHQGNGTAEIFSDVPEVFTFSMHGREPSVQFTARVAAVARWVMGAGMNVQVPPNLTERFEAYLAAGVNDWGGVSPVTIDWVNPEAPWPHLEVLRARTEAEGFRLAPRLPLYPEFIDEAWVDPALLPRVRAAVDAAGHALTPQEAA